MIGAQCGHTPGLDDGQIDSLRLLQAVRTDMGLGHQLREQSCHAVGGSARLGPAGQKGNADIDGLVWLARPQQVLGQKVAGALKPIVQREGICDKLCL